MSYTLATMNECIEMAGASVNSTLSGSNILSKFADQSEGSLCSQTRYDWIANYASVGTNFKPILAETVAAMTALKAINYDMSGYTSRTEAQTMLDVLKDIVVRNVEALKDDKVKQAVL